MVLGSLANTKRITSVGDVIKILVIMKGMTLSDAFKEYEACHGEISYPIKENIIWEYDHVWSKSK